MSNITQPHKANTNSSIEYNDKKCSSITQTIENNTRVVGQ